MNNNSNVNNNSNNNVGNLNAISAQLSAASSIPDDRGFNSANLSMHNNMTRTTPTNASTLNMESNRRGASNWTPFLESLNANNIGDWNTASSPETNSTSGLNGTAFWNNNDFPNMEAERNKGFDEHSHNSLNSMNSQTDSWPSFSRGNTNSFPGNSSNYSSDNRMPSNNAFDLSKRGAIRLGGPSTNSLGVILKSQQQSQQPQQRPHSWEVGYGSAYRPMEHSSNTLYTEYGQPNPESHMYGQTSRQPINSMKGKANMQANAYSNPSGASAGYNNGHNPLFANDANAMSSDPASHYHLQQSNNPNNNYNRKYHDWNT